MCIGDGNDPSLIADDLVVDARPASSNQTPCFTVRCCEPRQGKKLKCRDPPLYTGAWNLNFRETFRSLNKLRNVRKCHNAEHGLGCRSRGGSRLPSVA